ncbi:hypothetical protein HNQ59_002026 [Chitinivorax tropicus]|uniref:Uncharacterized protein n=1 Tax=Chitinivorax tropicus TaxID=714531 RepID=A0A840MRA2_9PROT|nr:hypothetical protein [Chitinivorax tropicus]MBB5018733.1 hypothetical protein [Chitinivorax tropicus]
MSDDITSKRVKTIALSAAIVALLVGGGSALFGSSGKKADGKHNGAHQAAADAHQSGQASGGATEAARKKLAAETLNNRTPDNQNNLTGAALGGGAIQLAQAGPNSSSGDSTSYGGGGGGSSSALPFKDGDLISLQCQDNVPGPKWLNGSTKAQYVGLSMQQENAPASTWWKVNLVKQGMLLESQDGSAGQYLSADGDKGLLLQANAGSPNAAWLIEKTERGWSLKHETPQGGRFVDCVAADKRVWLAPTRDGHLNGTSWKIVKKGSGSDTSAQQS